MIESIDVQICLAFLLRVFTYAASLKLNVPETNMIILIQSFVLMLILRSRNRLYIAKVLFLCFISEYFIYICYIGDVCVMFSVIHFIIYIAKA